MSKLSIVKCNSYKQKLVDEKVQESIELIGGIEKIVKPGDRVLLKVNTLVASSPEKAITTHPALFKAVAKLVKKARGIPLVGDSPGIDYHKPDMVWGPTGLGKAAAEVGAKIVNFHTHGIITVKNPTKNELVPEFYIAKPVLNADVVINLPKLKTHSFTLFTGAIKNLYGVLPGFYKKTIHALEPSPLNFAKILVDIFEIVKPQLTLMDGILAMEGEGPAAGKPRPLGLIIASKDSVAVDAVASCIIGYKPFDIDTTRIAHQRGLGTGKLENIEILGENLEEVKVADFKLVSNVNLLLKNLSGVISLFRYIAPYFLKIEPYVNKNRCTGCGTCVKNCPIKALSMKNGYPIINRKICIRCFVCHEICPERAVDIRKSWLARKLSI